MATRGDGQLGSGQPGPGGGHGEPVQGRGRGTHGGLGVGGPSQHTGPADFLEPGVQPRPAREQRASQLERGLPPRRPVRALARPVPERGAGGGPDDRGQAADPGPGGQLGVQPGQVDGDPLGGHDAAEQPGQRVPLDPVEALEHDPALGAQAARLQPVTQHGPDPVQRRITEPTGGHPVRAHPTGRSRWPSQVCRYWAMPRSFGSRNAS